ncbi:MAG TPA: hypothetical protein VGK29_14810 [Paludibaculum sp.]|jgi:hypothetical protein
MRAAGAILLVLLSAGMSGCWTFKKQAPKPLPPLNPPKIEPTLTPPPVDLPPEATTPIQVEPPPRSPEVIVIRPELQSLPENKPSKAQPRPVAKKPVQAPVQAPAPAPAPAAAAPPASPAPPEIAPETPVAPPPQLAELISDQRRGEMQREIEQSLERARSVLTTYAQRALNRRQSETANRIRTFIRQAEEAKSRDISTALQLARRADLLARDLSAVTN